MKKLLSLCVSAALFLGITACGQPDGAGAQTPSPAPPSSAPGVSAPAVSEPAQKSEIYDLRVGQMGTSIKAAMVVLAHEMGYYEEEGLNVTLESISNLNDGVTAIMAGKLDILPFGVIPTCTFVSQGAELSVFGGTIAEGSACVALPGRAEEFSDLTGFAGKTIACVRPETGHMMMKAAIREAGIDLDTVEFVELDGFQSVVEAVLKGSADVGFVNSGFEENARTQGLEVPFLVGEYAPDAVCCRQTASKSAVEANREAYVRFQTANLRAVKLMLDDPDTTVAKLTAFSGQDEAYVHYCIYESPMKISMDPAKNRVLEFYQIMKDNGDIPADTTYDMADAVDVTIYRDALNEMISRYPDYEPFQQMLKEFETNNGGN